MIFDGSATFFDVKTCENELRLKSYEPFPLQKSFYSLKFFAGILEKAIKAWAGFNQSSFEQNHHENGVNQWTTNKIKSASVWKWVSS
jgi:hypothetical protein